MCVDYNNIKILNMFETINKWKQQFEGWKKGKNIKTFQKHYHFMYNSIVKQKSIVYIYIYYIAIIKLKMTKF